MSRTIGEEAEKVWGKGKTVSGNAPETWRQDECGAWIRHDDYGDQSSMYGWQIDHITPQSRGGSDNLSNLRPLQHQNNEKKADGRLSCAVTASGTKNIKV